jgi:purine-binding chemotaxis protein CheW
LSKKFDKFSPKDISEEKFNQLIDSLPSSGLEGAADKTSKLEDPKSFDEEKTDLPPDVVVQTGNKPTNAYLDEKKNETSFIDTEELTEVFVYEAGDLRFGIPVSFVTEITNDYGPVSKLDGFIRSCLGTCEYRGKLLPIFDSGRAYLKPRKNKDGKKKQNKDFLKNPIITVDFNGVVFALTMEAHVGLVRVQLSLGEIQSAKETNEFLDEIVWYEEKNLYIFSPSKIARAVSRELNGQIVASTDLTVRADKENEADKDKQLVDYLIAKIKDSYVAVEITKVLEVIEGFEVTSLYRVSDFIRGLINLRGQVLACVDLSNYLGFSLMVIDERNKFIVISEGGSDFALCVDELIGIRALNGHSFQETEKVFLEDIAQFFPSFIDERDDLTLIMRPELFVNSNSLLDYKKN